MEGKGEYASGEPMLELDGATIWEKGEEEDVFVFVLPKLEWSRSQRERHAKATRIDLSGTRHAPEREEIEDDTNLRGLVGLVGLFATKHPQLDLFSTSNQQRQQHQHHQCTQSTARSRLWSM